MYCKTYRYDAAFLLHCIPCRVHRAFVSLDLAERQSLHEPATKQRSNNLSVHTQQQLRYAAASKALSDRTCDVGIDGNSLFTILLDALSWSSALWLASLCVAGNLTLDTVEAQLVGEWIRLRLDCLCCGRAVPLNALCPTGAP